LTPHGRQPLRALLAKGEHSHGAKGVASRKLWHALHAIDNYVILMFDSAGLHMDYT